MTNALPPYCLNWISRFLEISWWIIILSAILGGLYALAELRARWRTPPSPDEGGGSAAILTPLKDLVEALAKAPAWFALFLAGLGLLWMTSSQLPLICRPAAPLPIVDKTTNDANPAGSTSAGAKACKGQAGQPCPKQQADPESGG